MLGPPRLTFASSRTTSKIPDVSNNAADSSHEAHKDYKTRPDLRFRFSKDKDKDENHRDRTSVMNGRRKEDLADKWANSRTRKFGQPESSKYQRDDERDRGLHETRQDPDHREGATRRNGVNRGKLDQKWPRDQGSLPFRENDRTGPRGHGWRDRERQDDKDWARSNRVEQDPEWLEETDEDDKKEVHTQEEFQLWRERMRAGTIGESQAKNHTSLLQSGEDNAAHNSISQIPSEGGFDKLLGKWNDAKKPEIGRESGQVWKTQASKSKSSRFAGFFAPQEDNLRNAQDPVPEERRSVERTESSDDKEGFQRILQMLGSVNTGSNTLNQPPASLVPETITAGLYGRENSKYREEASLGANDVGVNKNTVSHEQSSKVPNGQLSLNPEFLPQPRTTDPVALQNLLALSSGPSHTALDPQTHRAQALFNDRRPEDTNLTSGGAFHASHLQPPNANMNQLDPTLNKDSEFLLNLMHQPNLRLPQHNELSPPMGLDSQSNPYYNSKLGAISEAAPRNLSQVPYDDRIPFDHTSARPDINAGMGMMNASVQKTRPNYHDGPLIGPPRRNLTDQFQRNPAGMAQQMNAEYLSQKHGGMPMLQERNLPPPGFGNGNHMLRQPPSFGLPHQPMWNTPNLRNHGGAASYHQGQGPPPVGSAAFFTHAGVPPGFPPGRP